MRDLSWWLIFVGCLMVTGLVVSLTISSVLPIVGTALLAVISLDPILDFFADRWKRLTKPVKVITPCSTPSIEDWHPGLPLPLGISYSDCMRFFAMNHQSTESVSQTSEDTEVDLETFLSEGKEDQNV